jgi:hypothetical protein
VSVAVGASNSCALTETGAVFCWGLAGYDEKLGRIIRSGPVRVKGLARVQALALGEAHACAADDGERVYCWGANDFGELGLGSARGTSDERALLAPMGASPQYERRPTQVPGVPDAVAVWAGDQASCALRVDRRLACWGAGYDCEGPALMPEFGDDIVRIAGEEDALCFVSAGNVAREVPPLDVRGDRSETCHGYDSDPRVRDRAENADRVACVAAVGCQDCIGCARHLDGKLSCWPEPDSDAEHTERLIAVAAKLTGIRDVAVDRGTACVLTDRGRLLCWGRNAAERGDGTARPLLVPPFTEVPTLVPAEPAWPE